MNEIKVVDKDFWKKQNQIYLYVQHCGFVDWLQIRRICNTLIESCRPEEAMWYGKYPEYKLFCPLVYNGVIEFASYDNKAGFCLSKKINLLQGNADDFLYLNHFSEEAEEIKISAEECRKNAMKILMNYPTLDSIIKQWYSSLILNQECYRREFLYSFSQLPARICVNSLFKLEPFAYKSDYISLSDGKMYKIPGETFESINIARTYLRFCDGEKNKNEAHFIYSKKEECLQYSASYFELPVAVYRALLLFNIEQLCEKNIFLPNRNNMHFEKIPYNAVEQIKRILGNNSIEEWNQ